MELKEIRKNIYEIPREGKMLVPGRVYASSKLLQKMKGDDTLNQVRNVSCVPGILKYSLVMPDGHQGYGMAIGGVAAFDAENGSISPGQTGFDINCGVRIVRTNLSRKDILGKEKQLLNILYDKIPLGLGKGKTVPVSDSDFESILRVGTKWAIEKGYAFQEDLDHAEEGGSMDGDPSKASDKARARGRQQVGSLGSGNHFMEVQEVGRIFNKKAAQSYGLFEGQIVIMIHTGSRGFGHQICSDYIRIMEKKYKHLVDKLPDRQLVYGPVGDGPAEDYFGAMQAAANFAWTNRQLLTYNVRQCFERIFKKDWESLGMDVLYDVAHNIIKKETYKVDGKKVEAFVHRKGATRAFPSGMKEVPSSYRSIGQPVLIPGSMGTSSWILAGGKGSIDLTFGSTAHGAGRMMSRARAKREFSGDRIVRELEKRKIYVRSRSGGQGVAEEAPGAYKDVDEVIEVSHELNIGTKVAQNLPIVCVKG